MTPSQIITRARSRYNAIGDNFFSDEELLDTLYEAEIDLALETECIEKRYQTDTVADQREYSFPTNLIRIDRCTYDGQRLDPIDFVEDDLITGNSENTSSTGKPKYFSQFQEIIFLRPVPSEVKTLEIFSTIEPQTVSLTSVLDIPSRYHIWTIDYILSTMFAKDKNFNLAKYHDSRWQFSVSKAKRWEMKRKVNDQYKASKDGAQMPYHGIYSNSEIF